MSAGCDAWLSAANITEPLSAGVDCDHAFYDVSGRLVRRGACVVDVEALQRANVYAGSDSTWPIAFHETTHSMRELLTAVGVDSCEAGCMQPAITFIGASVVAQLVASLRLEARLYQSGCERCFAQLSGTSLFLGNSRCPYRASEGGLDIWRASLEEPHNRTVAARRRACSVLHRSTDDGDSRRCSSGFDCAVARSRTIVIGWRSGHYGLSGTSPVHGGRLAIQSPRLRLAQSPRLCSAQSPRPRLARMPRLCSARTPHSCLAQSPRLYSAQSPRPCSGAAAAARLSRDGLRRGGAAAAAAWQSRGGSGGAESNGATR